ncbi:hypothetical protein I5677_16325 [Mobilitalea sibirica]|uniref:FlgN protein n=1 Tax=Mobilitalea sibirica TaxID=1462919 RepID=A0A8J7HEJ3_9FIRM|nr:hypothetical protein [Mobilitalea sibirica]MBH1942469.1 hypothetical protein [Mobilitalea sibirica]
MGLENGVSKQAYIQLLTEALGKKIKVMEQLLDITSRQEGIIASEKFDEDLFMQTIASKDEQIQLLDKLDTGFEKIYNYVKNEFAENSKSYKDEITLLQNQIKILTDLNVKVQALEKRNKSKLELIFSGKHKEIRNVRLNSKTVSSYYKTIAGQNEGQSFFYDKKN